MSSKTTAVDSGGSRATVTTDQRRLAEYLESAGIDTRRMIDVKPGTKQPARRWTLTRNQHHPDEVVGNYGVVAGGGLLVLDVDEHSKTVPEPFLDLVGANPTLGVRSAHDGAHLYYRAPHDAAERIDGICGTRNPSFDAVEICSADSLVIGPGSVLDGCNKEWCDDCSTDDGGRYEFHNQRPIATIDFERFLGIVDELTEESPEPEHTAPASGLTLNHDVSRFIESARDHDEYLNQLMECLGDSVFRPNRYDELRYPDRSRNETALACKLMRRFGGFADSERIVRRVMGQLNPPKWSERGDGYRDSVIDAARRLSVDVDEFYRPPDSSERAGGVLRQHADAITLIVKYTMEETFTTDDVASFVEIGERQTRKVLNDLKDCGYLTKTFVNDNEHFRKISEIDTTSETYDLFLSRYNTASEVRETRREYLAHHDDDDEPFTGL